LRKPFYGWIIVGVSFLIGITEAGVFQNILSIFMKPMVHDFGWSRASVTGAMAFGSICGGLLSLVFGPILDRHGPRMVAFGGIFLLSMGLVAMAFINRIWQLYLFFGVGRMIAIGVLSLVISVSVSNWFSRLRGRAMGITRIGDRFGSTLLPLMVQFLIFSTISVSGMVGSPIWGMLVERFRIQNLLTINVLGSGLLFLLLYWAVKFKFDGVLGTGIVFFLAALHGTLHGGRNPMITLAWAEFFGRRSLGSILSLSSPFHYAANAIGPVFAALCFDLSGSYAFPFYFFVFIFFFSGMISKRMEPPRHPSQAPIN